MNKVKNFWPSILIVFIVILFFFPVFRGNIPFPGDLLIGSNPYKTESYLGFAPGGYPNKGQGADVINEIYPWRYFSINELKHGNIPFWNPYNFSGNPQLANFQTAVFYPLNILYFLLPFNLSWTLIIMFQPLLAGIFMYLFLKKGIGLKDFPSVIGAVSFAFSSYMVVWIEYGNIGSTMLWLPLALLFVKRYFNKASSFNFLAVALTLSLAIISGYIQGAFYIYVLCFLYYSYLLFSVKGSITEYRKNFLFLVALILPFLITAFQIIPTLQIFSQSTRGAYSLSQIEKTLAPILTWVTIVFPDFFGNPASRNYWIDGTYIERVMYPGMVMVLFAFYSLLNKIQILEKKFFLGLGIVSLIIASNLPFVKYFYLIPIPVISTTIPTRELNVFIFCMIVLGSLGLEHFISEKNTKKIFGILSLVFIILVWSLTFLIPKFIPSLAENLKISQHNLIIPTALLVGVIASIVLKKFNRNFAMCLIAVLVVLDLFYFFNKITPFAPESFTYPATPVVEYIQKNAGINRVWGYGSAYIEPNFQSVDKTYSPEGNDPLHISRYGELLSASLNGKLPKVLPRPDANVAPGYGPDDLRNNPYRQKVLNLLGVKYVLHKQELVDAWYQPDLTTFPKEKYILVRKIYPWQVYENKNALPRYFVTGDYILANKADALNLVYGNSVDLKTTLVLENRPDIGIDKNAKGTVRLLSYNPNKVVFNVNTSGNMLLFLSDNNYSEWKAYVDGKETKIMTADYAFRSIAVPKGEHNVQFIYDAKGFKIGLLTGLLGIIILLSGFLYVKKNEKIL